MAGKGAGGGGADEMRSGGDGGRLAFSVEFTL